MFVEMPESIEVALLEQRVSLLRQELGMMAPDDRSRPQTIINLAREQELLIFARAQAGAASSPLVEAPSPDYTPVVTLYEQVLEEHPESHSQVRTAMLEAGHLLLEAGQAEAGQALLDRLIDEYPQTSESHSACLILGERSLVSGRLVEAQTYLSCAAETEERTIGDTANYMLGWVAVNLGEYERAFALFDQLRTTSPSEDLAAAADRDLLLVLAYLEHGVTRAIALFGDRPDHLSNLLSYLLDMAHPDFMTLAEHLLSTYPTHALAERWCSESANFAERLGQTFDHNACTGP